MIEELEHEHAREIPAELPKAGEAFMIRGDPFLVVGHHCWHEAWYVDIVWLETGLRNSFHKNIWLNMAWESCITKLTTKTVAKHVRKQALE